MTARLKRKTERTLVSHIASLEASKTVVEYSDSGLWRSVPALALDSRTGFLRGGFFKIAVIHQEGWTPGEIENPDAWVDALKVCRIGGRRADVFTFAQQLPNTNPRHRYPMEHVSTAALHIRSFEEWWEALPQETRKNVRRAQKRGLTVSVRQLDDELVRGIMDVNNESPFVQGKRARHFGKGFDEVWKDQRDYADRSSFVCAYFGEELAGFMKIVRCGAFASVLTTLTRPCHQDKRPANAIIARAVQLCQEEGISFLVYGQLNYGNKRSDSLREFKLRNGFEEFRLPRYYVPLSAKGEVYVKLKLYRGLIGILPPQAISAWRWLRKGWISLSSSHAGVAQR